MTTSAVFNSREELQEYMKTMFDSCAAVLKFADDDKGLIDVSCQKILAEGGGQDPEEFTTTVAAATVAAKTALAKVTIESYAVPFARDMAIQLGATWLVRETGSKYTLDSAKEAITVILREHFAEIF